MKYRTLIALILLLATFTGCVTTRPLTTGSYRLNSVKEVVPLFNSGKAEPIRIAVVEVGGTRQINESVGKVEFDMKLANIDWARKAVEVLKQSGYATEVAFVSKSLVDRAGSLSSFSEEKQIDLVIVTEMNISSFVACDPKGALLPSGTCKAVLKVQYYTPSGLVESQERTVSESLDLTFKYYEKAPEDVILEKMAAAHEKFGNTLMGMIGEFLKEGNVAHNPDFSGSLQDMSDTRRFTLHVNASKIEFNESMGKSVAKIFIARMTQGQYNPSEYYVSIPGAIGSPTFHFLSKSQQHNESWETVVVEHSFEEQIVMELPNEDWKMSILLADAEISEKPYSLQKDGVVLNNGLWQNGELPEFFVEVPKSESEAWLSIVPLQTSRKVKNGFTNSDMTLVYWRPKGNFSFSNPE